MHVCLENIKNCATVDLLVKLLSIFSDSDVRVVHQCQGFHIPLIPNFYIQCNCSLFEHLLEQNEKKHKTTTVVYITE